MFVKTLILLTFACLAVAIVLYALYLILKWGYDHILTTRAKEKRELDAKIADLRELTETLKELNK